MRLKNSLMFSVLLHLCLVSALVLLSDKMTDLNSLSGMSREFADSRIFSVKLAGDAVNNEAMKTTIDLQETQETAVYKSEAGIITAVTGPVHFSRFEDSKDNMTVETSEAGKPDNDMYEIGVNQHTEAEKNVFTDSDKTGAGSAYAISDGQKSAENLTFSSGRLTVEIGEGGEIIPLETMEIIRRSIEKAKAYPVLARKRGIEGTVYISFLIGSKGEPLDVRISKGSGSSILDNATRDIIRRAAPFPYVDSPIEVPVVFRLK